jgi:hypothetical protein
MESLDALESAVGRFRNIVETGDEMAFQELMEDGRRYLEKRLL